MKTNKLGVVYFIKFFSDAIFKGYLSMYFLNYFTEKSFEYGILLGIIPFCSLLGNFIWGQLSKGLRRNLFLVKLILTLEIFCMALFTFSGENFVSLLIFTILFGLFNSPCFSLQDGIASDVTSIENKSYTSIRTSGSIGYFAGLLFGSFLLKLVSNNIKILFLISIGLNIICLILWFFIKSNNDEDKYVENEDKISFKEVFKIKDYIFYLISYVLIIAFNDVGDSYLFARLNGSGLDQATYSLVFSIEILIEVVVMILVNKFVKENHQKLFLNIFVLFVFFRNFMMCFDLPLGVLCVLTSLRGVGWGGVLALHLNILKKIVNRELVTKSIAIITILVSLINGIFTIVAPNIISSIGIELFYLIMSIIQLIGIIVLYLHRFKIKYNKGDKNVSKSI